MLITQRALSHIRQLDGSLGTCVHEPIAALWVEFGSCNDLGQFLHIRWFDVNDIEALVLNVEVPEVDSQIVTADEGLSITVDGDAVDVVSMGVCVCSAWDCSDNSIVVCHSGQL